MGVACVCVAWALHQGDIAKEAVAAGSKGLAFARVAADGSGALEGAKALVEGLDQSHTAALIQRTGAEVCVRVFSALIWGAGGRVRTAAYALCGRRQAAEGGIGSTHASLPHHTKLHALSGERSGERALEHAAGHAAGYLPGPRAPPEWPFGGHSGPPSNGLNKLNRATAQMNHERDHQAAAFWPHSIGAPPYRTLY